MRHSLSFYHTKNGQSENPKIESNASALKVFLVILHFDRDRQLAPAIDLGPAGNARDQLVNPLLSSQSYQVILVEQRRPRTDETHISPEHAIELR